VNECLEDSVDMSADLRAIGPLDCRPPASSQPGANTPSLE
jgi:hypothetical protein